jgi:glycosyltransferase involved in cell wall biosynthesis
VKENEKVITIVSRLLAEKGYFEFAEMARIVHQKHPETKFWIIGRSEEDRADGLAIDDIISDEMRSYVKYLGFRSDMPLIYAAMDIFVFPSHHEGMPRSLMEASAMGKTIVASDIRGCREVIQKDRTGLLFPVQNASAFAKVVSSLLDSPKMMSTLGQNARSHALENFDERAYFTRLDQTYQSLLASRNLD